MKSRASRTRWRWAAFASLVCVGGLLIHSRGTPQPAASAVPASTLSPARSEKQRVEPPVPSKLSPSRPFVAGSVRGASGASLRGATVCAVVTPEECCAQQHCTITDPAGAFQITALPAGVRALVASAEQYAARVEWLDPAALPAGVQQVTIVLSPAGEGIDGKVLDVTGGVIADAWLTAHSVATGELLAAAGSRPDGSFRLSLPHGRVQLQAVADGYARASEELLAPARGIVVSVVPSSELSGFVLSAGDEEPVVGARVTAANVDGLRAKPASVESGPDGSFRFEGLSAGRYELAAVARAWRSERRVALLGIGEAATVHLSAVPAGTLEGSLRVAGDPCTSGAFDVSGPLLFGQPSSATGGYELTGLVPGVYHVSASCLEPAALSSSADITVGAAPSQHDWDLSADPAAANAAATPPGDECCTPSGRVRVMLEAAAGHAAEGNTGPSLRVLLATSESESTISGQQQGDAFVFEKLPLGQYYAFIEQSPQVRAAAVLARDGQIVELRLQPPSRARIAGRVSDSSGVPVPDAWVRATSAVGVGKPLEIAPVLTGSEGEFSFEQLFEGRYTLVAESPRGGAQLDGVSTGASDVVLAVVAQGSFSGTVKASTGRPVQWFSLLAQREGAKPVRISGSNAWSAAMFPVGSYEVAVASDVGFALAHAEVQPNRETELSVVVGGTGVEGLPEWASALARRGNSALEDNNSKE